MQTIEANLEMIIIIIIIITVIIIMNLEMISSSLRTSSSFPVASSVEGPELSSLFQQFYLFGSVKSSRRHNLCASKALNLHLSGSGLSWVSLGLSNSLGLLRE